MEPTLLLGLFSFIALIAWLFGFKAGYSSATKELKSKLGFRFQAPDEGGY